MEDVPKDPTKLTKLQLKSWLSGHGVELPAHEKNKPFYVNLVNEFAADARKRMQESHKAQAKAQREPPKKLLPQTRKRTADNEGFSTPTAPIPPKRPKKTPTSVESHVNYFQSASPVKAAAAGESPAMVAATETPMIFRLAPDELPADSPLRRELANEEERRRATILSPSFAPPAPPAQRGAALASPPVAVLASVATETPAAAAQESPTPRIRGRRVVFESSAGAPTAEARSAARPKVTTPGRRVATPRRERATGRSSLASHVITAESASSAKLRTTSLEAMRSSQTQETHSTGTSKKKRPLAVFVFGAMAVVLAYGLMVALGEGGAGAMLPLGFRSVYCASPRPDGVVAPAVEGCVPCPRHGVCVNGEFARCEPLYRKRHFGSSCVVDNRVLSSVTLVTAEIQQHVCEETGKADCAAPHPSLLRIHSSPVARALCRFFGTLTASSFLSDAGICPTRAADGSGFTVMESDLVAFLKERQVVPADKFDSVFTLALHSLLRPTVVRVLEEGEARQFSCAEPTRTFVCRIRNRALKNVHGSVVIAAIATIIPIVLVVARGRIATSREVSRLVAAARELLQERARSGRADPYIAAQHLRDHILAGDDDSRMRRRGLKLWPKVESVLARDSRTKAMPWLTNGIQRTVWQWTGPT